MWQGGGSSIHTYGIVEVFLYSALEEKQRKCMEFIWHSCCLQRWVCISWLQVNANGSVMSSDIVGSIKLKTMLSGMPELRLGLNDRVLFALTGRTFKSSFRPCPLFTSQHIHDSFPGHIHTGLHVAFRWQRQDGGDGGREVPPVCSSVTLRKWQNNLFHSSWWRVRTHVLPHQHAC